MAGTLKNCASCTVACSTQMLMTGKTALHENQFAKKNNYSIVTVKVSKSILTMFQNSNGKCDMVPKSFVDSFLYFELINSRSNQQ